MKKSNKNVVRLTESDLRKIVAESVKQVLSETINTKKLYHCVDPMGKRSLADDIHVIVNNGLLVNDNGERGNCIWFNVGEPFYHNFRGMIVSIMATPENIERFRMTDDYSQMSARESIPFEFLTVEQIPFWACNGQLMISIKSFRKNEDFISMLNRLEFENIIVYKDVVDRFSGQILDWNKLTNHNVKLINIL